VFPDTVAQTCIVHAKAQLVIQFEYRFMVSE